MTLKLMSRLPRERFRRMRLSSIQALIKDRLLKMTRKLTAGGLLNTSLLVLL